jgi:hypothetical protein
MRDWGLVTGDKGELLPQSPITNPQSLSSEILCLTNY